MREYRHENWRKEICNHIILSYDTIQTRILESFHYVTPHTENRYTYSYTYSSILRDVGSTFDSIMRQMITQTNNTDNYDNNILGHLNFLKDIEPHLERCSILFKNIMKTILPFEREPDKPPSWWSAYNKIKHHDVIHYEQGNLENVLRGFAGLTILYYMICENIPSLLFTNVGIKYPKDDPQILNENRLFPSCA